MTEVGSVYGESLYELAKDENLTKAERCQILDDSFRNKVHAYVLNFLKILTEKGYMRFFSDCCDAYTQHFDQDNGILRVNAVTAVALTSQQADKLTQKLSRITGKEIALRNRIDPAVLGGVRLDYDGQRLDDTVSHRMDAIRDLLNKTVL